MRIIKIFLASSIDDLRSDRLEVGDFIQQLNNIYIKSNLYFKLIKCESYDKALNIVGKQFEYDDEIRESELIFFLFYLKVGDYTKHEFEVALESFRLSEKPKIITYFKYVKTVEEIGSDVKSFMNVLDNNLKHYYNTYQSIDTLKLGIIMQIKLLNLDSAVIDIEKGKLRINGSEFANAENIPMFGKNENLLTLKKQLKEVESSYFDLYEKRRENPEDMEIYSQFYNAASAKAKLEEQIREAEKRLLELSEKMTRDRSSGSLSKRQITGYKLLEKGDFDGALEILNLDEINKDIAHNELISEAYTDRLQQNVNELLQRIDVLEQTGNGGRIYDEIFEIYEEAYRIAKKHSLSKNFLFDYSSALRNQNRYAEAVKIAERLKYYYNDPDKDVNEVKIADLLILLGLLYTDTQRFSEAERAYADAAEIYKKIINENPQLYASALSVCYNDIGTLYSTEQRFSEAEKAFTKAFEIRKKLAAENPEGYEGYLADSYNNLGHLYYDTQRFKEAEDYYKNSLKLYKKLSDNDSESYLYYLAIGYNNIGSLYNNTYRFDEAEEAQKKALEIRKKLAEKNPEAYAPCLADSYNNIGIIYSITHRFNEAEDAFKKALEIRKSLAETDPEAFAPSLAAGYNNMGNMYKNLQRNAEAEASYKKALEIQKKLAENDPEVYASDLAMIYNNLGLFYLAEQELSKAEASYKKALEIQKRLAEKNPEIYAYDLGCGYSRIGNLYIKTKRFEEAEEVYINALEIRKGLAEKKPETYGPDLTVSCYNMGILYEEMNEPEKAKVYFEKAFREAEKYRETNEPCKKIYNDLMSLLKH
ncbi:MAG: tetratricopeptide repeat protein [Clostridiales bacterium]|nr:tetratricopeptide repeat protein [Clostridiales bacterium]